MDRTSNVRVREVVPLLSPRELKARLPVSRNATETVVRARRAIAAVLSGRDTRMLAIVGPCSIHDPTAAREYARRLKQLHDEVADRLLVIMRVYFEKPRTKLGWRGLILDPNLDGSYEIEDGLRQARRLLIEITELGLPSGSEVLDPIVPNYIDDLVSWAAIGARTTESQTHRDMASGLSMPVGFKNGTDGNVETALNAMTSSVAPHSFVGIDQDGNTSVVHTEGNDQLHVILRGGRSGPNYHPWDVVRTEEMLQRSGLPCNIVIDCSHGNSNKDHQRQASVLQSVVTQRLDGRRSLKGFMIESNLLPGNQPLVESVAPAYGVSITDACIGWDETERLIRRTAADLTPVMEVGR